MYESMNYYELVSSGDCYYIIQREIDTNSKLHLTLICRLDADKTLTRNVVVIVVYFG